MNLTGAAFIRAQLAWSYAAKGMYPQALAEYDKIAESGKSVAAENQLEKGYEERSAGMPYLVVDPFWSGMRSDPRFTDLLRRIGLPSE